MQPRQHLVSPVGAPARVLSQRAWVDAASLAIGREHRLRRAAALADCYRAIPAGDILAQLDETNDLSDIGPTLGLMAGFLDKVGRRSEALHLLSLWIRSIIERRSPNETINVCALASAGFVALDNVPEEGRFALLGDDAFMLHPNDFHEPDATCTIDLVLCGHSAAKGQMQVRHEQGPPVMFGARLLDGENAIFTFSQIVLPDRSVPFEVSFEPFFGAAKLQLTTRVTNQTNHNYFAHAVWRGLEFLSPP